MLYEKAPHRADVTEPGSRTDVLDWEIGLLEQSPRLVDPDATHEICRRRVEVSAAPAAERARAHSGGNRVRSSSRKRQCVVALAKACHEDYKSYSTNDEWLSRDALAEVLKQIGASVPDLAWSVTDIMVSGDRVIVRGEATGTPVGELFGARPTGRSFKTMALDVLTVRGDKLASAYHVENWVSAIQQSQR